ncbi:hypothetical protein BGC07_04615 [Piscirickettsia litoralis]|uniref:Haemolysin activator HlyB C-terminal domain-containing protein n=2 Tax=Piscirickettsia litoralis TaxID=1891921 RepID=A0ABX3A0F5_9GAMM|nr:hypothetical protein BGC07_04615 [Piscirickettsia litoralis]
MPNYHEMSYGQLSYLRFLNDQGLSLTINGSVIVTKPNASLSDLNIHGKSEALSIKLDYPLLLLRRQQWRVFLEFNAQNSINNIESTNQQNQDNVRTLTLGTSFKKNSSLGQSNLTASVSQGLPLFGSSHNNNPDSSRIGVDYHFTRVDIAATQLYPLSSLTSLQGSLKTTYAFSQLPATAEAGFGGPSYGRAYDSSRITGDRGVMLSLESRYDIKKPHSSISLLQPYLFYDIGALWVVNPQNRPIEFQDNGGRMSASSAGVGLRVFLKNNFYGTLEIAKPLTLSTLNHSYDPRVFFSLVGRF